MSLSSKKAHIRKLTLGMRLDLSHESLYRKSLSIQKRFLQLDEFIGAERIALYKSFKNEVLTGDILSAALREGKEVFFPKVANGRRGLDFIKVESEDDFAAGIYDIAEPKGGVVLERPSLFHLMVVPGVAFDVKGNRLGYGKGYYDMTLKGAECCIVALAFNFQVVDYIGSEPHDVGVHKIVTEDRILDVAC